MDRRLFLTGMLSVIGAAAVSGVTASGAAMAAVPNAREGILDELDAPDTRLFQGESGQTELEPVQYWRGPRRRHRRRVWRRVCRRYWRRGRSRVQCYRRLVWI